MKIIERMEDDIYSHYHTPISMIANDECLEFEDILLEVQARNRNNDVWRFA